MDIVKIPVSKLEANTGQIDGLPSNPRQWTQSDIDKIAVSVKETPELFEARPCLVVPHGGKYVVLGGNLRLTGARQNKEKAVPCIVFPEDTPVDKLKEIVIKDNGSFGSWDFDELANKWDDLPLGEWGVPAWAGEEEESGAVAGAAREDDFAEENDAISVRCKKGDVWQLGEHRLMCGDSIDLEQVKFLMGGGQG